MLAFMLSWSEVHTVDLPTLLHVPSGLVILHTRSVMHLLTHDYTIPLAHPNQSKKSCEEELYPASSLLLHVT